MVDEDLLGPLLRDGELSDWLDPQAIGRVDNRLRRLGRPPRTAEEMAEHLRRLGDLTAAELAGPMAAFLAELQASGRAVTIELPGTIDPLRWILAEDVSLYRAAFPGAIEYGVSQGPDRASHSPPAEKARDDDRRAVPADSRPDRPGRPDGPLSDRPGRGDRAARTLGRGGEGDPAWTGRTRPEESRWAERDNLAEMRRATVAVRRRESLAVSPEVFADFLLRWQHVHPSTRGEGPAFVETVLQQLQGYAMPARLWESEILPRRVEGYRPAWLDAMLDRGTWLWRAEGGIGRPAPTRNLRMSGSLLRVSRGWPSSSGISRLRPKQRANSRDLSADEARVLELLERTGASFATDLARTSGSSRRGCAARSPA